MNATPKKLVCGVGHNDADYVVTQRINGKRVWCLFYRTWQHMLERCYSSRQNTENPTYRGCTVAPEWHSFSNFKAWMEKQDWQGRQLDKDLLIPGNKVYGPDRCLFVAPRINSLLGDSAAQRGDLPLGVCLGHGRFRAMCRNAGSRQRHLGLYSTPAEAHRAWQHAKLAAINDAWLTEPDERVCRALVRIAGNLLDDIEADRETEAFGIGALRAKYPAGGPL